MVEKIEINTTTTGQSLEEEAAALDDASKTPVEPKNFEETALEKLNEAKL